MLKRVNNEKNGTCTSIKPAKASLQDSGKFEGNRGRIISRITPKSTWNNRKVRGKVISEENARIYEWTSSKTPERPHTKPSIDTSGTLIISLNFTRAHSIYAPKEISETNRLKVKNRAHEKYKCTRQCVQPSTRHYRTERVVLRSSFALNHYIMALEMLSKHRSRR